MAISAATVFECRASGASDNHGGGFVAGSSGIDFSQVNANQAAVSDGVTNTTTTVTSATAGFSAPMAGCVLNIVGQGFFKIVTVSNATTILVDRTTGTGASKRLNVGPTPLLSVTDGVTNGTTTVTSVTGGFTSSHVGLTLNIIGDNVYSITAVTNTNTVTVDRTTGTATGLSLLVGCHPPLSLTDLVSAQNSLTVTSASAGFTAQQVGSLIQIASGTNFLAGFYQVATFTNATTITVDRFPATAGAGSVGVAILGGALATLGKLAGAMIFSNKAYCVGAFTATASVTFAQTGGPTSTAPYTRLIGYGATRGDATHATLTLATNTGLTGISATGVGFSVEQIDVDCGSLGTSTGISVGTNGMIQRCKASNFTTAGLAATGTFVGFAECEVTGGTAAATAAINQPNQGAVVTSCYVHDNGCPGIKFAQNALVQSNLCVNNSGASSDGIIMSNASNTVVNNTCHGNGRDGVRVNSANTTNLRIRNNLVTNNGGFGITLNTGTALPAAAEYDGNAYGGGASANTSGTVAGTVGSAGYSTAGIYGVNPYTSIHDVTLSASPYIGPTSGSTANFGLNNVAGAGAACRKSGSPGTWPGNTGSTSFLDFGAVQTASGGGVPGIIVPV